MRMLIEFVFITITGALLGILFWCAVFNIDLGEVTIIKQFVETFSTSDVSTGLPNVLRRSK